VLAYYKTQSGQPPGGLVADLAKALRVSADGLLGLKPLKDGTTPRTARLLKRLRKVGELPPADQRAVFKMVEAPRPVAPSPLVSDARPKPGAVNRLSVSRTGERSKAGSFHHANACAHHTRTLWSFPVMKWADSPAA
jgi:hypothetical protein